MCELIITNKASKEVKLELLFKGNGQQVFPWMPTVSNGIFFLPLNIKIHHF